MSTARYWYVNNLNKVCGPYLPDVLQLIWANNGIRRDNLICPIESNEWIDGHDLLFDLPDSPEVEHDPIENVILEKERVIRLVSLLYNFPPGTQSNRMCPMESQVICPTTLSHNNWLDLPGYIRTRAFSIPEMTNKPFLEFVHSLFLDILHHTRVMTPRGETSKVQGESHFVCLMRNFMKETGMIGPEAVGREYHDDARNIGSLARGHQIFKTILSSNLAKGAWEKAMSPTEMAANPAYRFVRFPGADRKRLAHEQNENVVRLKTDYQFWIYEMNSRDCGGFEVPWGPFGTDSYMYQDPVSREECEQIGLLKPGEKIPYPDWIREYGIDLSEEYNHAANTHKLSEDVPPELIERLREQLRQQLRQLQNSRSINKTGNAMPPTNKVS